LRGIVAHW